MKPHERVEKKIAETLTRELEGMIKEYSEEAVHEEMEMYDKMSPDDILEDFVLWVANTDFIQVQRRLNNKQYTTGEYEING